MATKYRKLTSAVAADDDVQTLKILKTVLAKRIEDPETTDRAFSDAVSNLRQVMKELREIAEVEDEKKKIEQEIINAENNILSLAGERQKKNKTA